MRLLRNILALVPCGQPQAAHFAHLVVLLQWQPECLNLYWPRALRQPAGAHPCALVCAALPFRAPERGRAGDKHYPGSFVVEHQLGSLMGCAVVFAGRKPRLKPHSVSSSNCLATMLVSSSMDVAASSRAGQWLTRNWLPD